MRRSFTGFAGKLPSNFDYIFVHLRQKARLRPEISLKFSSTLSPNPARKARPDLQLKVTFYTLWSDPLLNSLTRVDCEFKTIIAKTLDLFMD